jgi:hypothetical protein
MALNLSPQARLGEAAVKQFLGGQMSETQFVSHRADVQTMVEECIAAGTLRPEAREAYFSGVLEAARYSQGLRGLTQAEHSAAESASAHAHGRSTFSLGDSAPASFSDELLALYRKVRAEQQSDGNALMLVSRMEHLAAERGISFEALDQQLQVAARVITVRDSRGNVVYSGSTPPKFPGNQGSG